MSTDRELLELAARAEGYKHIDFLSFDVDGYANVYDADGRQYHWNPLDDDGDALRLAVKLNLTIKIMGDHVKVGWRGCGEQWPGEDVPVNANQVMPIATRRAIVRAAAEIGRSMK
jgi:hypothetical protein